MELFAVELGDVDDFHDLVRALIAVVDEGEFTVTEEGLSLRSMDPSRVAMVDFSLPAKFFDEYSCPEETRIYLNLKNFEDFLDRIGGDERVRIEAGEGVLVIRCSKAGRSRRFSIPLMEPIREEAPKPKVSLRVRARLLTESLYRSIRDGMLVSEHVKIEADIGEKSLQVRAEGPFGSVNTRWTEGSEGMLELEIEEDQREIGSNYTLSYLIDILGAARRSSEVVTLELGESMPLKLDFALPEGKLLYYIAPLIEE